MSYIGREPQIGNFQVCDAISVVNGQAAYTMQVGGVNVSPETANHMLVSLNGVLQAPGSSYTVSGSTITFASNLVTGDVINFIHILGSVLDLGVPSDNTVTAAKVANDLISGKTALASEPADTDEFLVSDAGVLKRIDYSLIKGGGSHVLLSTTTVSSGVAQVDITSNIDSTYNNYLLSITNMHIASSSNFRMRFFTGTGGSQAVDTGSNYTYGGDGRRSDAVIQEGAASNDHMVVSIGQNIGSDNEDSLCANFYLCNPSNTTFNTLLHGSFVFQDGSNRAAGGTNFLSYQSTTAVTGVRFYMESGNIDSGIFKLYGIV